MTSRTGGLFPTEFTIVIKEHPTIGWVVTSDAHRGFRYIIMPEEGLPEGLRQVPSQLRMLLVAQRDIDISRKSSSMPPPEGFQREVLTILIEECAEVIQRATKALRFGIEEVQPGQGWTNDCRIAQEVGDLYATINLAQRHGLIAPGCVADGMIRKEARLAKYMQTMPPS